MIRSTGWLIIVAALSLTQSTPSGFAGNPAEQRISTLAEVREQFSDPPAAYRPAPLYVWNDDMQEEELARQLDEFKKQGYGGVFVHPRPGLITPYLSERWLELWRFTAEEAEKRGMVTYIYDENSYPSGFAGGHVPERMPEARQVSLRRQEFSPDQLDRLVVNANTIALYRLSPSNDSPYVRLPLPKLAEGEKKTAKDLGLEPNSYIVYSRQYGNSSPWYGGRFFVDLMRPGVGDAFLDITFGAYDKALSDLYGKTVLACFTDEPQVAGCWSSAIPSAFQERWGYDILDHLPSIHADAGDWRRVRHDYAQTILDLFMNNFAKPYYEACEKRGLPSTGHIWEHGWPNLTHNPDIMSYNSWQHWPGIDCLMNQYSEGPNAQFGNYRANKEIDSIANQFGRIRKLCETYGAGGWELTFEDMKRIGDHLYAGGVNLLNPHLSYYTIRGARKRDHPQSFSYHAPYWEAYHISMDYFGRLSWTLAGGKEKNPILVIEPTTTMWMYNWSPSQQKTLDILGPAFQRFVTKLGASQVAFDLGSEPVMARIASVKGKQLIVGECAYDVVILPPGLENLERSTVNLLEEYAEQGGEIISLVGVPAYVEGRPDKSANRIKEKAGSCWSEDDLPPSELQRRWGNGGLQITSSPPKNGRVFHYTREFEDGYLLFLANSSMEEASKGSVEVTCKRVEKWNPANGNRCSIDAKSKDNGLSRRSWDFDLPPAGSALFAIYTQEDEDVAPTVRPTVSSKPVELSGKLKIEALEANVLPLDYVDLVLKGELTEGLYFYDAQTRIYQAHGFDKNPWDSAVQFKDEILQKDHFPDDSGFELRYPFTIGAFETMPDLKAVVERGDRYSVEINGQVVEPEKGEWYLDQSFTVYNMKPEWLHKGRNTLTTKASPFTLHHEPESVYILGDFNLASAEKGWTIEVPKPLDLGPWSNQGRPCYPGKVAYSQTLKCENNAGADFFVELQDWKGTVARVDVNGETAGYIGWRPWRLEITDHLQTGENTISVVVFGSLKNLLGPHHNNPGRGAAWPSMFHRGPKEGQPAGDQYDVIDYGLTAPFNIIQANH